MPNNTFIKLFQAGGAQDQPKNNSQKRSEDTEEADEGVDFGEDPPRNQRKRPNRSTRRQGDELQSIQYMDQNYVESSLDENGGADSSVNNGAEQAGFGSGALMRP